MELLRQTAETDAPVEDTESEGRGEPAAPKRARRVKAAPTGKTRARNIRLSDDVHDRLWQLAHSKRSTVSAMADSLLDKALPRFKVEREG